MKRDPVFSETMQIGIVVRDLDATIRRYEDDFGIGPWDTFEVNSENTRDVREHGEPVRRSWRVRGAVTMVGTVMWELIEPLDEESVVGHFLAEKGVGVHHIAVATPDFDEVVATQAERGNELVLSGAFSGVRIAYLATDRDLGVVTEVFDRLPDGVAAPGEQD